MFWLFGSQFLVFVGMLVAAAVLRHRDAQAPLDDEEVARLRAGIRLVPPDLVRRVRRAEADMSPPGWLAQWLQAIGECIVYAMRQFAVYILGAQWRPRRDVPAFIHPYAGRTRQLPHWRP